MSEPVHDVDGVLAPSATGAPEPSPAGDLSAEEVRVLGCLVEKASTTPDNYPLTLNALRTACNQSTSRDPVVEFSDRDVEIALRSLRDRGLTRTVHSTSNRAAKYRHVLPDVFRLDEAATAALAVLMLRGPQTVGELKSRTDRIHHFDSVDDVAATLDDLAGRAEPLVHRLARQPGQKDHRWEHLLGPVSAPAGEPEEPDEEPVADHLVTVFDHDRLRIDVGRRPGGDGVDVRVAVRAEPFGGVLTATLADADLDRFVVGLEDDAVARHQLGGGATALVELTTKAGPGPALDVECSIVSTEDDPREWLQFTMVGVPPFAAETAARARSALVAPDAGSDREPPAS